MVKALIGGIVVAIAAGIVLYLWSVNYRTVNDTQAREIAELHQRLSRVEQENQNLKADLAKVQSEEHNLAEQNEALRKAIASVKATGKVPDGLTGYPPK